jgi:deoxyribonuclease (pyrimidine dimer)
MTRVNSAIPVKLLCDELLLAEHREIKRLPKVLEKSLRTRGLCKIPESFVLGPGHVKFFMDKMKFIKQRYAEVYNECVNRGFAVQDYSSSFEHIPPEYMNDYEPTTQEYVLLIGRISTRIKESKKSKFHYYKKAISKDEAIAFLCT